MDDNKNLDNWKTNNVLKPEFTVDGYTYYSIKAANKTSRYYKNTDHRKKKIAVLNREVVQTLLRAISQKKEVIVHE